MQLHSFFLIVASWCAVLLFRFLLLPVRIPNVEPLLASIMPLRSLGRVGAALFAFSSIVVYDSITAGLGMHTWIAGGMYAVIALGASVYFDHFSSTRMHFVIYGVIATLVFDGITGPVMISIVDGLPFLAVLAAQVPFTILHLVGTVLFALSLSPLLAVLHARAIARDAKASAAYARSI